MALAECPPSNQGDPGVTVASAHHPWLACPLVALRPREYRLDPPKQ
jgi:hypothetical protein